MAITTDKSRVDFDWSLIAKAVKIDEDVVSLSGGELGLTIAAQNVPLRCSGMPVCQLFEPRRKFPSIEHVVAPTGCPYIDARRITGS